MRTSQRLLVLALLLMLPAGAMARRNMPEPIACPDDVAAALAAVCPCDAAENHGQYVRCVARFRNTLRKSGCLTDAERGVLRCAAHSTCGREGAVVCCVPSRYGVRTRIARDEGRCIAAKGTPLGTGSMCVACLVTTTSTSTSSSSSSSTSSTSSTSTSTSTTVAVGGVYGNAIEFPAASAHAPHFLVGGPVMVTVAGTLTHLAVIAKAGGPNVAIGLYSSNAMGEPNQLVASSAITALGVGPMEIPVTPTVLTAGKYWLFGVFDTDASIGIDESDPAAVVRYVSRPFGSPLPNPFGLAAGYSGQRFNYYIRVE